jgi:hypothetical protein
MNAIILITGTILLGLGLSMLLVFLIMLARRISYYSQSHKLKRAPRGVSYLAIILAAILLVFAWTFFHFSADLKGFKPYNPETRVCLIDIARTSDPIKSLRFIIYSVKADSLKENPEFYVSGDSWYLKGQLLNVSGYIAKAFPATHAFKLNDIYGEFIGETNASADQTIFAHRVIGDGPADLTQYVKVIRFIRGSFQTSDFVTPPVLAGLHDRYWLAISDSGLVSLEPAK